MSFYKKYELQRLIADGEAKTFRAIENSTGRLVYLHLFNPSGQRLLAILKSKLGSVPGKPVPPLLEIGEFAGSTYAVTLPIEPFSGLREWVALNLDTSDPKMAETSPLLIAPSQAAPAEATPVPPLVSETPAPPPPPPIPSPPPVAEPPGLLADQAGEFTRMFVAVPPAKDQPMPPAAPPPPSPIPSPPPVAEPPGLLADQAGEFTRMFVAVPPAKDQSAPPAGPPPPPPIPSPPVAAPPSLLADQRGEFTRIFDPEPPKTPAPSSAAPASEFSKLFEGPPSPQSAAPPASAQSQGGEFTKLFQAPPGSGEPLKPPSPPAAPPPVARRPGASFPPAAPDSPWPASSASDASLETGQFTRLFGSRLSGESIDIEKEHASAAQSAPPDSRPFQQAGEFTRMFGPTSTAAADTAAPAPIAPPPALNTATRTASASGIFGTPQDLARHAAEALAASKPADAGPGEYTRMFGPPAKQGDEQQAAQQPAAPKPPNPEMQPPKKSRKNLIIVIAVVAAVLILAIVLLIVLGRSSH
ncbi:MAG: hypothetical protein ABSB88_26105 [Bryobacteraceae bacterium]|jgi:hypothetical protein